jgi:hypothetical protein
MWRYRLRKLTKNGDDNARIYVDQSVMNVLKCQKERQDAERERLGSAWVDHDLSFGRDGFTLYRGEAGGPQDPEKVSARWRTMRNRPHLPKDFRIHDSKVTNDLEAGENPSRSPPTSGTIRRATPWPGTTTHVRTERADWLLRCGPARAVVPGLTWGILRLLVTWLVTPQPWKAESPT